MSFTLTCLEEFSKPFFLVGYFQNFIGSANHLLLGFYHILKTHPDKIRSNHRLAETPFETPGTTLGITGLKLNNENAKGNGHLAR